MRRKLNSIKDEQFPWMREVTKNAPQQAIKNLGTAFKNFFAFNKRYRKREHKRPQLKLVVTNKPADTKKREAA